MPLPFLSLPQLTVPMAAAGLSVAVRSSVSSVLSASDVGATVMPVMTLVRPEQRPKASPPIFVTV